MSGRGSSLASELFFLAGEGWGGKGRLLVGQEERLDGDEEREEMQAKRRFCGVPPARENRRSHALCSTSAFVGFKSCGFVPRPHQTASNQSKRA